MFTFEKTDEGFQVFTADRRAVATVDCCRVEFTDEKGTLKVPRKVADKWPREKWAVHFTGHKFSLAQVAALLDELGRQEF